MSMGKDGDAMKEKSVLIVKDVEFVWEEVLSFEGETGPYVQYTHARLASILRKGAAAGETPGGAEEIDGALLADAAPLLMALLRYPEVLRSAAAHAEPSEVVSWLLAFCRETNAWYGKNRVLGQESALQRAVHDHAVEAGLNCQVLVVMDRCVVV